MARTHRIAIVIAAAAAVGLTLAGCVPGAEPTPTASHTTTPTPTATTDPQPQSEGEATAAAELAIADFLYIRGQVNAAGGTDTAPLEEIATDRALQLAIDDAGRIAEGGLRTEGQISFTPTLSYANTLENSTTNIPFGYASVVGCQDGSSYKIFNSDGTPAQQPTQLRNEIQFDVIWDPAVELWLVYKVVVTGASC